MATFALAVQMGHLSPPDAALASVTTHPALAMGLPWDGKIKVGCSADLLLLEATSPFGLVNVGGVSARRLKAGSE